MKNKIIAQKILNRADAATRLTPLVVKLKVLDQKTSIFTSIYTSAGPAVFID